MDGVLVDIESDKPEKIKVIHKAIDKLSPPIPRKKKSPGALLPRIPREIEPTEEEEWSE